MFTDMQAWTEIRRGVLVEGASTLDPPRVRDAIETLQKILRHPEPPGYRLHLPRAKTKLGPRMRLKLVGSIIQGPVPGFGKNR